MRISKIILAFSLTTLVVRAHSQDIWLRPDKYFYEPRDTTFVQFATGADFIAKPFIPSAGEVELLELRTKAKKDNIKDSIQSDLRKPLKLFLTEEGANFIFFQTTRTFNFNGEEFNDFLKQYGIDDLLAARKRDNKLGDPATIIARNTIQLSLRRGKNNAQEWNKVARLPIEIIPDKNPQTLKRGDRIQFTVYENGAPAFGVRVKIWNRWDKRTTIQNIYTEKDGIVSTTISNPGDWMVTVAKINGANSQNQFDVDVFSLNFGYR